MVSYHEIDIGPYRFILEVDMKNINNVDVSKTDYYLGDPTNYYDIMTSNKSRVYDADGRRRNGTIFKRTIIVPPNMSTDEEIMDVSNDEAIAYPTGMILYIDKHDFDEDALRYLCMILYDYATINGYVNQYTKYILDKKFPTKELNWN